MSLSRSRTLGYTLLEVTVVSAVMVGMFAVTGTVLVRTAKVWRAEEAFAEVSQGLRNASMALSRELEIAGLEADLTATPPTIGLTIGEDADSVKFHLPASARGGAWSAPVTYRLRNEDLDGDLELDSDEDVDKNGVLDRVIERLQDADGNGVITPAETRVVARNVDELKLVRRPGTPWVDVTIVSRSQDAGRAGAIVSQSSSISVMVKN